MTAVVGAGPLYTAHNGQWLGNCSSLTLADLRVIISQLADRTGGQNGQLNLGGVPAAAGLTTDDGDAAFLKNWYISTDYASPVPGTLY